VHVGGYKAMKKRKIIEKNHRWKEARVSTEE